MSKFLDENGLKVVKRHLDTKVDKVSGKQLSTEDFTSAEKTKLENIEAGAEVNDVTSVAGKTGAVVLDKTDVGLDNVDNTSDLNKPISTATQTALDGKVDKVTGKGLSTEDFTTAEKNKLSGIESGAQVNTVSSVAGKTGVVALVKGDVGLGNVDNTSDLDKPVSTATQTALDGKQATLVSGTNIKTINSESVVGSGDLTLYNVATEDEVRALFDRISGSTLTLNSGVDITNHVLDAEDYEVENHTLVIA